MSSQDVSQSYHSVGESDVIDDDVFELSKTENENDLSQTDSDEIEQSQQQLAMKKADQLDSPANESSANNGKLKTAVHSSCALKLYKFTNCG